MKGEEIPSAAHPFLRRRLPELVVVFAMSALVVGVAAYQLPRARQANRELAASRALIQATIRHDVPRVLAAIAAGANLEWHDRLGFTALHHAAASHHSGVIEALIQGGADPNVQGATRQSVLSLTVAGSDLESVRLLLESGADPNRGDPPPLHQCIRYGNVPIMELLLARGARIDLDGKSQSLSVALTSGLERKTRLHVLQVLFAHGATLAAGTAGDGAPASSDPGFDPMLAAIADSDEELVDLLAKHGAAYTVREAVAFHRPQDVQRMVQADPTLLTQTFLDVAPTGRLRGTEQRTLLAMAITRGYRDIADFLLDAGSSLDFVSDRSADTLLHLAARAGDNYLARRLIEARLDLNPLNLFGWTPLHYAVRGDRPELCATLISAGADVNAHADRGDTPLHVAASQNNARLIHFLLEKGADPGFRNAYNQIARDVIDRSKFPELVALLDPVRSRRE